VLSASVAREASHVYEKIQSGELDLGGRFQKMFDALPPWASNWLNRFGVFDVNDLKTRAGKGVSQASKVVIVQAINIGQSTFSFLLNLFVMLYLLFFLLRDGNDLSDRVRKAIPL